MIKVNFNEKSHRYWLDDGTELSGITSRLAKSVFFHGKFDRIPKHILENKRQHGSNVHKQIELYDRGLPYIPIKEVSSYADLKKKNGIVTFDNEVLVTDGHTYATAIDMIDENFCLYDHKTSYRLDLEYLSWQLSIGAFLFEKSKDFEKNNEIKPKDLLAIHYDKNGDCKLVPIKRKTDEEVYDMLYTDKYMYTGLPSIAEDSLIKIEPEIAEKMASLDDMIKSMSDELEALVNGIGAEMNKHGIDKVEFGRVCVTVTKPYTRSSIDSKALQEAYPEIASQFTKQANVKSSIKLKIKDA